MTTTITGKNQVTLPAVLIREMGWKVETKIDWQKLDEHSLVARAQPSRGDIARHAMGLVRAKPGTHPIEDLQRMQEEEDSTF